MSECHTHTNTRTRTRTHAYTHDHGARGADNRDDCDGHDDDDDHDVWDARYKLPVVVLVFNNNGIYGGDRRPQQLRTEASAGLAASGLAGDPTPTEFCRDSRYDALMQAFGGDGYLTRDAAELASVCAAAFAAKRPALVNVVLDPMAGVESGNVHAFNAPKAKL